ncbi:MAG TPA: M20/M25/M40 family metallo-hydrolase [Caulobacteraceae bacterium]|nr:M20/M25/M40 family metallo-hydrolase [Caulobacteraceae bacterium]
MTRHGTTSKATNRDVAVAALTLGGVLLAGCAGGPLGALGTLGAGNGGSLMRDLRVLAADDMAGRAPGTEGGAKARAYLLGRLREVGLQPFAGGWEQPFTRQSRGKTVGGVNLLGFVRGTARPDRWIVVTAHYDHLGVREGQIHNGADDNASGVASMLELARALRTAAPRHSVAFVALDAEEQGLAGARAFVEAPPVPLSQVALNLNLDMTARADDGLLWVAGAHQHPSLRPILEPLTAEGPVSLRFGKDTPADKGPDNWVMASDHGAFHEKGVPFLYFGVDYHPDYHAPTDDADKVEPARLEASTRLIVRAFRALDAAL